MEEVRPVRALLKALTQQPWKAAADHPLLASLQQLNALYETGRARAAGGHRAVARPGLAQESAGR